MADPGDRPLDNPSLGKDFKADVVQALDDFDDPGAGLFRRLGGLRTLITAVGIDALDERKQPARSAVEDLCDAVRSWMLAGWTTTFSSRPSVSTRMWRLRPVTFFPAS